MKKKFIIKDARRLLAEQINSSQIVEGKNMNIETMSKMKGLSEVIPKDNDGYCTVYKMDCADGLGLMTVYQAFPGIQLIYNDFEATEYEWEGIFDKNILEINHCREGREGSRLLSGSCLYLGEGDLSIHTMDNCASEMSFPLKHYRGISVVINLETVSKNPPAILEEAGIDIMEFRDKFCASGNCFIMRAKDEIEHIFSELYFVPDCLQKPYMKLKVQELLLFLYMVDAAKEKQREQYTSPHVETVVLLSHKKPDGHINVKVEFGEGEGKVPLDNIAKRAEEYKPKERVTYKMIKEYIEAKYGFKVHTAYIAEVKRDLGLPMYDAPNAVEELKQPRKHPTAEKVEAIKDALKHFKII